MDTRAEIRDFLTSRRARITPEDVGLTTYGSRRVPGLRREEVATLAGVSVDYYNRMERGNLSGVSDSVLDARLDHRLGGDRGERAPGRPRYQPAWAGVLFVPVRRHWPFGQLRALHLPRSPRQVVLRRLGPRCEGKCRAAAHRGRPHPVRPGPLRPGRRAVDAKRGVPRPLGRTQRPSPQQG